MKRKVNKLRKYGFLVEEDENKVNVEFLDGFDLVYKGNNKRKFMRRVLKCRSK